MRCTRACPGVVIPLLRHCFSLRESWFVRVCVPRCFKSWFGMLLATVWRASGWVSRSHGHALKHFRITTESNHTGVCEKNARYPSFRNQKYI